MDSFEVENFRSLKHLKLEKLARVNLLVGKNNSGKTTVLESLYTLCHIEFTYWPMMNKRNRELSQTDLRYFFYKFNNKSRINLTASFMPSDEEVKISSKCVWRAEFFTRDWFLSDNPDSLYKSNNLLQQTAITTALINLYASPRNEPYPFEMSINLQAASSEESVRIKPLSQEAEKLKFVGVEFPAYTRTIVNLVDTHDGVLSVIGDLEKLKISKQGQEIVEALNLIDSQISSVDIIAGDIYVDLGPEFPMLMPVSLMGDGVQRLLLIVARIISRRGGIVIIDEIDNGLHYSVLRILWREILKTARTYDVQIFVTTHSAEALRNLTWVLDEKEGEDYRDDVAAYTLVRADDDTVRSYRHDYEQLDYALDHGLEIRN